MVEVVISGHRPDCSRPVCIEQGVAAVNRVVGQGVGHGVSQSSGPGGVDAVVDALTQAGRHHDFGPVRWGVVGVEAAADALIAVAQEVAAVVVIADASVEAVVLAALARSKAVVVLHAGPDGLVTDPVGIGLHGLFKCGLARACGDCHPRRAEPRQPHIARAAVVFPGFLPQGQVLLGGLSMLGREAGLEKPALLLNS